jgi:membrane-bound lytic murein transglycosylase B
MDVLALFARPALLLAACAAFALPQVARAADPPSRKLVEIYRIAPGRHLEFLQMIARFDEASRAAGIPPRDLYVHQDGAGWDFMLIQNAEYTDEQSAKLAEAMTKLGLPRGAHFFIEFRRNVAEHSDTFAEGPTTAGAWLDKLK